MKLLHIYQSTHYSSTFHNFSKLNHIIIFFSWPYEISNFFDPFFSLSHSILSYSFSSLRHKVKEFSLRLEDTEILRHFPFVSFEYALSLSLIFIAKANKITIDLVSPSQKPRCFERFITSMNTLRFFLVSFYALRMHFPCNLSQHRRNGWCYTKRKWSVNNFRTLTLTELNFSYGTQTGTIRFSKNNGFFFSIEYNGKSAKQETFINSHN